MAKGRSLVLDHDAYVAFFPGAWYSGGPDVRQGKVLEYYWNVQTPAEWTGKAFRQYDLELDVKCRADHACQVFDREEFLAKRHLYPRAWVEEAERAVEAILRHMGEGRWPGLPPGEPLPWMERSEGKKRGGLALGGASVPGPKTFRGTRVWPSRRQYPSRTTW